MEPIDIIIIVLVAVAVVAVIASLVVKKIKGKPVGCDCGGGCSGCPSAGACGGSCKKEKTEEENVGEEERKPSCPHCAAKREKENGNDETV